MQNVSHYTGTGTPLFPIVLFPVPVPVPVPESASVNKPLVITVVNVYGSLVFFTEQNHERSILYAILAEYIGYTEWNCFVRN